MAVKKEKNSPDIIALYMDHALEHEHFPNSVYKFCKVNKIEESVFYHHYASLDTVKHSVWTAFFDNVHALLEKNDAFSSLSRKDRLLSFYYTFFEVLLLNRSYVLMALNQGDQPMKNLGQLKDLRKSVKRFAEELIEEGNEDKSRFTTNPVELFSEATWAQLLLLMKFWLSDTSKGFEKTDGEIFVERSNWKSIIENFRSYPNWENRTCE